MGSLLHTKVKVEPPAKKRELPQCKNCQQVGHTKTYCTRKPKCVKCGLDHETKQCRKKKENPAKCANCDGDHTANWRGCPVYHYHYQAKIAAISKPKMTVIDRVKQRTTQNQEQITTQKPEQAKIVKRNLPKNNMDELDEPLELEEQASLKDIWELLKKWIKEFLKLKTHKTRSKQRNIHQLKPHDLVIDIIKNK
ncbi:uncharacterized protein LOC135845118 [Planococcus citri]|uniref:uncharacterized protein LOC135845118 n=1 Tax=Planococcus citri TaxID=170843 RepID=UPI0031F7CB16